MIEGTGSTRFGKRGWAAAEPITERNRQVLRHWLRHKRGADFIAVDRKTASRSHDDSAYTAAQQMGLTAWFGRVTRQLRGLAPLQVWYAEDYFAEDPNWRFQAAGLASMLHRHVRSGAAVSLRWGPQGKRGGPARGTSRACFRTPASQTESGLSPPMPSIAPSTVTSAAARPSTGRGPPPGGCSPWPPGGGSC